MIVNIIFPHQLFKDSPLFNASNSNTNAGKTILIEEFLFFNQYNFHQQKLAFHRASMQFYQHFLQKKGVSVQYIDAQNKLSDVRQLLPALQKEGISEIYYIDPTDNWLSKHLRQTACSTGIVLHQLHSPLFMNTVEEFSQFFEGKKRMHQTDFYVYERKKRNILIDEEQKPEGGKWTYDVDNRKKYPRKKTPPAVNFPDSTDFYEEARQYVEQHYANNYGQLHPQIVYPHTHNGAVQWLQHFFEQRFVEFGPYEDAIVAEETFLHHSILTPMLNVGLLTPKAVIDASIHYAKQNNVPLNSLEGFVRQIMGWREFIRAVYELKGSQERTTNYWGFERKIPENFWQGTTGIPPIDITIKKVLKTGYCHHIERLMVLGNFMLLCEFHPDEVYRWFMELFIDAYDWVMVPNVYGMSQFADGGLMATKPYISGSNYLKKMSNFKKGDWQATWDGLFWRFMHVHRDFFLKNPRLGMLVRMYDKMPEIKQQQHISHAEAYLKSLY